MKVQRPVDVTHLAQAPGSPRDLDVTQYYVLGTDDSAPRPLYWVMDSTRDDLEVAGPMDDLVAAHILAAELNEAALAMEAALVLVQAEPADDDRPLPGKIYQITGGPGDRCLLNTGRWADSEVVS